MKVTIAQFDASLSYDTYRHLYNNTIRNLEITQKLFKSRHLIIVLQIT